jgi:hypothetical protein
MRQRVTKKLGEIIETLHDGFDSRVHR